MGFFNKTQIKSSGTHTTLKKELPIAQALSSIRIPEKEKGTKNPTHLQVNISKWFRKTKEQ
jgi:hypothetical protein